MQPIEKNSFLALSLSEFVTSTKTSVRLHNSIIKAVSLGVCPFPTIEDYLNAHESAIDKILCIPNLGKKTAYEMDKLINDMATRFEINIVNSESVKNAYDGPDFIWNGEKLSTQFLKQDLYELIKSRPTSVRINNLFEAFFNSENFPCRTVKDLLVGGEKVSIRLLRYKNFGRTTIKELQALVDQFLDEQINDSKECLTPKGPWQLMCDLLDSLKPKEYKVLSCRYGFANKSIMTLEEIGDSLGLTRERIRQIEQKAIKKLSVKTNKIQMSNVLLHEQTRIFGLLSDSKGVAWKKKMTMLPGEYRLAIDIVYGSFSTWIKSMAVEFKAGWLRSDLYTSEFKTCQKKICKILSELRLPTPFAIMSEMVDEDIQFTHLCASLLDDYYIYEGLIYSSFPGKRKKRQACLYYILQSESYKQLERLIEQHNIYYPSMQCSARDAQIVMAEAQHLFLSLNDYGWATLGHNTSYSRAVMDNIVEENTSADIDDNESNKEIFGNIRSAIKQVLEEHGPLHFVALRDRFIETFGDLYSPNSLGPILLTYKEFVRLAPAVYGLRPHIHSDVLSRNKKLLLSEVSCTLYVLSRWSGEPMNAYPWWTSEMEYTWCKWAKLRPDKLLFYSIMAIAEPDDWPINDDERQSWLEIKKTKACYSLQFPHKHSLADCLPTLRELYAVMIVTSVQSSMSWIRINRVLGYRLNDQYAATYLALLIALGALEPTDHWQRLHTQGRRLGDLIKDLSLHLCIQEDIPWHSDLGKSYVSHMEEINRYSSLGWVEEDEFRTLLDRLASEKIEGMEYIIGNVKRKPNDSVLEMMLNQKEKENRHERMSDLIEELINDRYNEE